MRRRLLLATNNKAKLREYRDLLRDLSFKLVSLKEAGISTVVNEVGSTLEENARLKATELAEESRLLSLADDSGLEVDALGGEPGPLSARYAGEGATDKERVSFLLAKLEGIPRERRTARFRCVIAVAVPGGGVEFSGGECQGLITFEPRGHQGFGYDPVFYLPELDKTMAELSMKVKNTISHRGQAARGVPAALAKLGL